MIINGNFTIQGEQFIDPDVTVGRLQSSPPSLDVQIDCLVVDGNKSLSFTIDNSTMSPQTKPVSRDDSDIWAWVVTYFQDNY